jgi:hypothetical protein
MAMSTAVTYTTNKPNLVDYIAGIAMAMSTTVNYTPIKPIYITESLTAGMAISTNVQYNRTPEYYELTYQASGPGSIIGDDEGTYQENTSIYVQAEPISGYSFSHWESNVATLDGNTSQVLNFNITQDTDLTAIFN